MSTVGLAAPKLQSVLEKLKSQTRLGIHSFHRYFGKLIPAIPAAAVEEYSRPGDTVLDPFCGSGTTLVEALVRGRNAVGLDINPLSVLISRVKTTRFEIAGLIGLAVLVIKRGREIYENGSPPPPYCVNIHHWYRPKVIRQLSSLHMAAGEVNAGPEKDFITACLSAINRNVSNADPRHVFPGYSKRLRKLDLEKGRKLDVFEAFRNGVSKRIPYLEELNDYVNGSATAEVHHCNADDMLGLKGHVDLIVTNPPYISSVRYLETLKLEMSWAGFITSPENYRLLDREQIGTERFSIEETHSFMITGIRAVDRICKNLYENGTAKMSRTVSTYFHRIVAAFDSWDNVLKPGGKIVFKISPSHIRNELVPTPDLIARIFARKGYQLVERFEDCYNPNSRSLLTTRNYYSGRMDSDEILVLAKP